MNERGVNASADPIAAGVNKSTTVRKAVDPITIVRSNTPDEFSSVWHKPNPVAASLMTNASPNVTPRTGVTPAR